MKRKTHRSLLAKTIRLRLSVSRKIKSFQQHPSLEPLCEVADVRQLSGQGFRRWYRSRRLDLIVWYDSDKKTPVGFQLCYNKNLDEHAITWTKDRGYSHNMIDDGETRSSPTGYKMAPVLVPDGAFDAQAVADEYLASIGEVDQEAANLVHAKLRQYPG